jgi:hypothetical protein
VLCFHEWSCVIAFALKARRAERTCVIVSIIRAFRRPGVRALEITRRRASARLPRTALEQANVELTIEFVGCTIQVAVR